jgi:DNA-binding CsgD family transcriptional regulator
LDDQEALKNLNKLSKRELEVLKLVCEGLTYQDIAQKLNFSESTVKSHMGNIYVKLGLDQSPRRLRSFALADIYCKSIRDSEFKPPLDIDKHESGKELIPNPISKELMRMVEEDDGGPLLVYPGEIIEAIPIDHPRDRYIPSRKPNPFMTGFLIIALISILYTGFSIFNRFFGPTSVSPSVSSEKPEQPVVQASSSDAVQPSPTMTEFPAASATLPPKPKVLFEDNFDQGLSEVWDVVSGNPMIVNGMLTSDQDVWLMVGDPTWKNYSVEFKAETDINAANLGFNIIGVRVVDIDNMYAYEFSTYDTLWSIVKDGKWNAIPGSTNLSGEKLNISDFKIIVNNSSITFYIDGIQKFSFVDSKYPHGQLIFKVSQGSIFDNFKVKEILD